MHALARSLATLAAERGVDLRYGQRVARIEVQAGRACGVLLADGQRMAADSVVFNGDVSALAAGLLGDAVRPAAAPVAAAQRSLSALT